MFSLFHCEVLISDVDAGACIIGVGSFPERNSVVNSTRPPTGVTESEGLAVAEEQHGNHEVFGSDGFRLQFSGSVYFLSCAGVACTAAMCFVLLRCCCYHTADVRIADKRNATGGDVDGQDAADRQNIATSTNTSLRVSVLPRQSPAVDVATASVADQPTSTNSKEAPYGRPPTTTVTRVLDDGTERQTGIFLTTDSVVDVNRASSDTRQYRRATVAAGPSRADIEAPLMSSTSSGPVSGLVARNRRHVKPLRFRFKSIDVTPASDGRPKLFRLLIVIVVWTSAVVGGPLSTVTSYACYPTGSWSFVAGSLVADTVAVLACAVAARATAGRSDVSTIIAMTCLGTIILIYYVALVLFSLHQHQHQQQLGASRATAMPLFGSTAEILAVSDNFPSPYAL